MASEKVCRARLNCAGRIMILLVAWIRGDTVHAVVMDFAKAFDKVPHQFLMGKLSRVPNINSKILMWIHDFLSERRQKVVVAQSQSSETSVTSGVPPDLY